MKRSVSVQLTREEVEAIVTEHLENKGYFVAHLSFQIGHQALCELTGGVLIAKENSIPVVVGANAQVDEPAPGDIAREAKEGFETLARVIVEESNERAGVAQFARELGSKLPSVRNGSETVNDCDSQSGSGEDARGGESGIKFVDPHDARTFVGYDTPEQRAALRARFDEADASLKELEAKRCPTIAVPEATLRDLDGALSLAADVLAFDPGCTAQGLAKRMRQLCGTIAMLLSEK